MDQFHEVDTLDLQLDKICKNRNFPIAQPKKNLTVGVVGLGQNDVRVASNHPSIKEVHVFDMDQIRAENVSQRFDCEIAPSYDPSPTGQVNAYSINIRASCPSGGSCARPVWTSCRSCSTSWPAI